jgi:protocatechuate 3,4-dioxygenase beta subunit
VSPRLLERLTFALAVLVCFLFVLGLRDTPRVRVRAAGAPAVPATNVARDAALEVLVLANGVRLPEASVSMFWEKEGRYYFASEGTTDGDGRTLLSELPRGESWALASAPGYARASARFELDAGLTRWEVRLVPERTLSVRVTDERGSPISDAAVLVTAEDPLPYAATSKDEGVASVPRLPPGPYRVSVSAPGYERVEREAVMGDIVVSLRRLAGLEVTVEHQDGRPAAGATVAIAGATLWPARRSTTDSLGKTRIAGLSAGAYDLQALLGSEISEPLVGFELDRGAEATVTLVLGPGRSVTALVTDGDGERALVVPNADVVLSPSGLGSFPLRGRTGTNGTVVLGPLASGPATLTARAEGFVTSPLVEVPEATTEPIRVALLRGATIRGEVVDGRGFPVDGASIEIVGTDAYGMPVAETPLLAAFRSTHFSWALSGPAPMIPAGELGVMPGPVPPIPPAGANFVTPGAVPIHAEPPPAVEPWITRSDGSFVASPVTPGRVRAIARHPDYVEGSSDLVTLGPGDEAKVKIVLNTGGILSGRVLDERGSAVDGAEVEIASTSTSLVRYLLTEPDGRFELSALPAEVVVSVTRPGESRRVSVRRTVRVAEGERTEVTIELPAPREAVRVLVEDGDGNPIELAEVTVLSLDPSVPLRETAFTDALGITEFADARGLALRVLVEAPGHPRVAEVTDEAPEELPIVLPEGVLVEGAVTAVSGRTAVSEASITLLTNGTRRATVTDAEGRFRIADVSPGTARLVIVHPNYAETSLEIEIKPTGRSDRALELEPVDLEEPGSVEGRVLDAEGEPVRGARVSASVAQAYLPAGALPHGVAITDDDGRFTLTHVAPGERTLEAFSAISGRGSVSGVAVTSGRATDRIEITLAPPGDEAALLGEGNVAVTLGEAKIEGRMEIVIAAVAAASEAERAGVLAGDVLVSVDGGSLGSLKGARRKLSGRPGSDVLLDLKRGEERVVLRVAREAVRR